MVCLDEFMNLPCRIVSRVDSNEVTHLEDFVLTKNYPIEIGSFIRSEGASKLEISRDERYHESYRFSAANLVEIGHDGEYRFFLEVLGLDPKEINAREEKYQEKRK